MKQNIAGAKRRMMNVLEADRISELPDEVLVSILSFMTVKEAARTSVLSRRWTKLWCFTSNLDFDAYETLRSLRLNNLTCDEVESLVAKASQEYVDSVNLVLKLHKGSSSLNQFRVGFDLNKNYQRDITTWVSFAIANKVKHLTMDFDQYYHGWKGEEVAYSFPSLLQLRTTNCSYLQKLYLRCVNIDANLIEHFITSACPLLEELAILGSGSLHDPAHLNIAGPSLCLKHLKIVCCSNIKSILLSATNLLSFEYKGRHVRDISYANVPNLVKVSVRWLNYRYNFPPLASCLLRRLETLELYVLHMHKDFAVDVKVLELPCLRKLKLRVFARNDQSLLKYTPLIEASPSLCRIKIVMHDNWGPDREKREAKEASKRLLGCLKEIDVVGFKGDTMETEFLEYLFDNAVMLKKVIIDCLSPALADSTDFELIDGIRKRAMPHAERLKYQYSLSDKLLLRNF